MLQPLTASRDGGSRYGHMKEAYPGVDFLKGESVH